MRGWRVRARRVLASSLRRRVGLAVGIAGGALLLHTGVVYARGAIAADRARSAWEAALVRAEIERSRASVDGSPRRAFAAGAPIARIMIPGARIDEIVVEGVEDAALMSGPGHLSESVLPGEVGNAVISAHRDRHFRNLGDVQIGDTVITETLEGTLRWVVAERRVRPAGTRVPLKTDAPMLTLSTCWPIRFMGSAPDRLVLVARRVS